jgi:hypothetical protein
MNKATAMRLYLQQIGSATCAQLRGHANCDYSTAWRFLQREIKGKRVSIIGNSGGIYQYAWTTEIEAVALLDRAADMLKHKLSDNIYAASLVYDIEKYVTAAA